MKSFLYLSLLAFLSQAPAHLRAQAFKPYKADKTIALPGNGGYDYISLDATARRLYVSHGTSVNVVDLRTEQPVGTVDNLTGIHGIAIASSLNKGFISDGKASTVVVFELTTLKTLKTIHITGKDPDAILYDPFTKRVFTFNGESKNASVIDAETLEPIGSIDLGGSPEFGVSDGAGLIYNNLEDKNALNVIDAKALRILHTYPLAPCGGPTGLALDKKNQRLFTVCRENKGMTVVEASTGKIVTTVPIGAGVDAVTYDPNTGLIFCSNGDGTATIIRQESADKYSVVQTLKTQFRAKTMALDPVTKKIYFSVYDLKDDKKTRVPDSFKLLVYKPS
ncbi:MAG: YncE family protein [Puia sp.]|nr:YncE family protein [Puia sp.]